MSRIETRESAVIFVYQSTFKDISYEEQLDQYIALNEELLDDIEYFKTVTSGVIEKKEELDEKISKFLKNWTINRLPRMDVAILEVACFEILYVDEIPTSVAINEAVKLSKKYGTPDSGSYVNGVLSSFEKSL
ncbi:MAG: transcription antitermination factor NusB [Clostridiales bacterium]|nr:transcription antitermination factor NusB [Clostridiales bacterium]